MNKCMYNVPKPQKTTKKQCDISFSFVSLTIVCCHGHVIRADVVFNRREREVTAALREIVTEDKMGAVTLHSPLTLATPIYAIHLGTHTHIHTQNITLHSGTACPFSHFALFSLAPSLSYSVSPLSLPHPLISSFAQPSLSLMWQWQTIVCGKFVGSPPTN